MAADTTPDRFASVHALLAEYDVLEREMADPPALEVTCKASPPVPVELKTELLL